MGVVGERGILTDPPRIAADSTARKVQVMTTSKKYPQELRRRVASMGPRRLLGL